MKYTFHRFNGSSFEQEFTSDIEAIDQLTFEPGTVKITNESDTLIWEEEPLDRIETKARQWMEENQNDDDASEAGFIDGANWAEGIGLNKIEVYRDKYSNYCNDNGLDNDIKSLTLGELIDFVEENILPEETD